MHSPLHRVIFAPFYPPLLFGVAGFFIRFVMAWPGLARCHVFHLKILTAPAHVDILRRMQPSKIPLVAVLLALLPPAVAGGAPAPAAPEAVALTLAEEIKFYCTVLGAAAHAIVSARDRDMAQEAVQDAMRENWIVGINRTLLRDALEVVDFAYGAGRDTGGPEIERFVTEKWCKGQLLEPDSSAGGGDPEETVPRGQEQSLMSR